MYIKVNKIQNNIGWQRPSDWATIPVIGSNEEVFYGLHTVWNNSVNPIALMCTGNYTVDWGDGSSPVNYASNVIAERNINYSLITSPVTVNGYKTVIVKVTPQAGSSITLLDLYKTSSTLGTHDYMRGWLDLRINFNDAYFRHWGARSTLLESLYMKVEKSGDPNININFKGMPRIQKIEILSWSQTNIDGAFRDCPMLTEGSIKIDLSVVTSAQYAFAYSGCAMPINTNFPNLINAFAYSINNTGTKLPTIASTVTNLQYAFKGFCFNVIPAVNCTNVTSFSNWLPDAKQITKSLAFGAKVSHSYSNQLLDANALNEIFTNLGTANSGATITITGNPGVNTCNQSIATSKGWTVIN